MKKILSSFFVLLLLLTFVGCQPVIKEEAVIQPVVEEKIVQPLSPTELALQQLNYYNESFLYDADYLNRMTEGLLFAVNNAQDVSIANDDLNNYFGLGIAGILPENYQECNYMKFECEITEVINGGVTGTSETFQEITAKQVGEGDGSFTFWNDRMSSALILGEEILVGDKLRIHAANYGITDSQTGLPFLTIYLAERIK